MCCPCGGVGDCRPFHFRTFASRPRPGRSSILLKTALKKKSTQMSILVKRNSILVKRNSILVKWKLGTGWLSYGFAPKPAGTAILLAFGENQSALVSKAPPTARIAQPTRHPCGSPSKAIPARLRQRRLTPARHAQALLMPATPRKLITIRPDRVAPALY